MPGIGDEKKYKPLLMMWLNNEMNTASDKFKSECVSLVLNKGHNEPQPNNHVGGSENLWIMKQASRHVVRNAGWNRGAEINRLITDGDAVSSKRLISWRDVEGLWGIEQLSPIYMGFQFLGHSVLYHFTQNSELKNNLVESFGSFIFYKNLTFGKNDISGTTPGMRGGGMDNISNPSLPFILSGVGNVPKRMKHYKSVPAVTFLDICREVSSPWGLRVPYHIAYIDSKPVVAWFDRDVNGNTPAIMAVRYPIIEVIPNNYSVSHRQGGAHQEIISTMTNGRLTIEYDGVYSTLPGYVAGKNVWTWGGVDYRVDTWGLLSMHSTEYPVNAQNGPSEPPNTPPPTNHTPPIVKRNWWKESFD